MSIIGVHLFYKYDGFMKCYLNTLKLQNSWDFKKL